MDPLVNAVAAILLCLTYRRHRQDQFLLFLALGAACGFGVGLYYLAMKVDAEWRITVLSVQMRRVLWLTQAVMVYISYFFYLAGIVLLVKRIRARSSAPAE